MCHGGNWRKDPQTFGFPPSFRVVRNNEMVAPFFEKMWFFSFRYEKWLRNKNNAARVLIVFLKREIHKPSLKLYAWFVVTLFLTWFFLRDPFRRDPPATLKPTEIYFERARKIHFQVFVAKRRIQQPKIKKVELMDRWCVRKKEKKTDREWKSFPTCLQLFLSAITVVFGAWPQIPPATARRMVLVTETNAHPHSAWNKRTGKEKNQILEKKKKRWKSLLCVGVLPVEPYQNKRRRRDGRPLPPDH